MSFQLIPYRYPDPVEYREVPGFPGYQVGNDGTVWSCRNRWQVEKWKQLKPGGQKSGHRHVCLRKDGVTHVRLVHRLVLEAFVGPCPPGLEACHGPDRRPSNNNLVNLRWDTRSNNHRDRESHGNTVRGARNPRAKLKDEEILAARDLCGKCGWSVERAAELFQVKYGTMLKVIQRKAWTHI